MSDFISVMLETGEIPESESSGPGVAKSFSNHFEELNRIARHLGITPLAEFYVEYMEQLEEIWSDESLDGDEIEAAANHVGDDGPWFDPDDGLRTVNGLIYHIESSPSGVPEKCWLDIPGADHGRAFLA